MPNTWYWGWSNEHESPGRRPTLDKGVNEGPSSSCSFNLAYLFLFLITVQTTIPFPFPQNDFSETESLIFPSEPWEAGLRTLHSLWGLQSRLAPNNFWTKLGALRLIHCTSGCHLYNLWTLPQMQNSTFNLGPVISLIPHTETPLENFPQPTHLNYTEATLKHGFICRPTWFSPPISERGGTETLLVP